MAVREASPITFTADEVNALVGVLERVEEDIFPPPSDDPAWEPFSTALEKLVVAQEDLA